MFEKKLVSISLVRTEIVNNYLVRLKQLLFFNLRIICNLARPYNTLVLSEEHVFHILILQKNFNYLLGLRLGD